MCMNKGFTEREYICFLCIYLFVVMDVSYFEPAEKFGKLKESFNI